MAVPTADQDDVTQHGVLGGLHSMISKFFNQALQRPLFIAGCKKGCTRSALVPQLLHQGAAVRVLAKAQQSR